MRHDPYVFGLHAVFFRKFFLPRLQFFCDRRGYVCREKHRRREHRAYCRKVSGVIVELSFNEAAKVIVRQDARIFSGEEGKYGGNRDKGLNVGVFFFEQQARKHGMKYEVKKNGILHPSREMDKEEKREEV